MTTIIEPTGFPAGVLALDCVSSSDFAGLIPFSDNSTNTVRVCAYSFGPIGNSSELDATMRVAVDRYDSLLRRLAD